MNTSGEYENGFIVSEIFKNFNVGIVTARDNFCLSENIDNLKQHIDDLCKLSEEELRIKYSLGKDTRDWQISYAKKDITELYFNKIEKYLYRPFDIMFTYYTGKSKGFHCMPRGSIMNQIYKHQNYALICNKKMKNRNGFPVFITKDIVDYHILETANANAYVFPLFNYSTALGKTTKEPNLNAEIVKEISKKLDLPFAPDSDGGTTNSFAPIDLLDYIYAVLHSPEYRETYKEFLKIDFPRVPYPTEQEMFWKMVSIGKQIRELHLMESTLLDTLITSFSGDGDNTVDKPKYQNGKVYINKNQYFDGVPETAWNFYIGGYQPLQKWLKDRKGRQLSDDDIIHYQKIVVALVETDRLMKEIDEVFEF